MPKHEAAELRKELRAQRALIRRLARALYTHARTDLAPDAALPSLRRLIKDIEAKP